jgi:formamidopyrimidine-DNA glycosylase
VPELPEVETIARQLRNAFHLPGRSFADVLIGWERTVATPRPEFFRQRLTGQRIEEIGRRGKFLTFALSEGDHLLIHLRMTGQLLVERASGVLGPHDRLLFLLDDGRQLRFQDTRKFGRAYLVGDPQEVLGRLGPEPLAEDFSAADFARLFGRRRASIKPLLINQNLIAGIGNIYADEALFVAGIHPQRRADSLSAGELGRLYAAIRQVLTAAIEQGGSSVDDYRRADGSRGEHQEELLVYGRAGEPCPRCGTPISRATVGGRSSHFCPRCQAGDLMAENHAGG